MKPLRVACVASHPSPYQRDMFAALARRPEIDLQVFYQEVTAPSHSPWGKASFADFEHELPGAAFGDWRIRVQWNWGFPRARDFDVWMVYTLHYSPGGQYLMRWHLRDVPWIFWGECLRELSGPWKPTVQHALATAMRGASAIAAIGEAAVADYRRRCPGVPVANIAYHTDMETFAAERLARSWPNEGEPLTILFCGQLIERKAFDLVLKAFGQLVQAGHNVRLMLLGQGAFGENLLEELPRDVRERVDAMGFQQPQDLPHHFARAHLMVLPSRQEGWGVVVNQALASGLAVVVSDAVGAADMIRPGENGDVVSVNDGAALTACLERLVADPDRLRAMGENAATASKDWSPEAGAEKWVRLLQETMAKASSATSEA